MAKLQLTELLSLEIAQVRTLYDVYVSLSREQLMRKLPGVDVTISGVDEETTILAALRYYKRVLGLRTIEMREDMNKGEKGNG